jgi:hypothetical protein
MAIDPKIKSARPYASVALAVGIGVFGAWLLPVLLAIQSDECSSDYGAANRVLSVLPPGVHCNGTKDWFFMPWATSAPTGLLALVLGAICGGLAGRAVARRLRQ